jgi:hypothetical protein
MKNTKSDNENQITQITVLYPGFHTLIIVMDRISVLMNNDQSYDVLLHETQMERKRTEKRNDWGNSIEGDGAECRSQLGRRD